MLNAYSKEEFFFALSSSKSTWKGPIVIDCTFVCNAISNWKKTRSPSLKSKGSKN